MNQNRTPKTNTEAYAKGFTAGESTERYAIQITGTTARSLEARKTNAEAYRRAARTNHAAGVADGRIAAITAAS